VKIYAHRGSSGTHPENTIAAFQAAAELPVYGVEFDVHMTKDGELVVIHDETIDRTSNGSGFVKDMTLEELEKFDFGEWYSPNFKGEKIPTLREVLDVYKATNHHLNIELKSDVFPYVGMEQKVLNLLEEKGMFDRVVISSFNHEMVQKVKKLAPQIETAILFVEVMIAPHKYADLISADSLHAFFPTVLRQMGKEAVESGKKVRVYTVNEEQYVDLLKAVGIDAIFTDYPKKMHAYLNE